MKINHTSKGLQLLRELQLLRVGVNSQTLFNQVVEIVRKRYCPDRDARAMMLVKPISGVIICSDKNWEDFSPYSGDLDKMVPHVVYNPSNASSVSIFRHSDAY